MVGLDDLSGLSNLNDSFILCSLEILLYCSNDAHLVLIVQKRSQNGWVT